MGFGEINGTDTFEIVDERQMRASAGLMFLLGLVAFINAFLLQRFIVVPYISGFLLLNFIIGLFINSKYAPTMILAGFITRKQSKLPIGAIQKKFAWSLGLGMASLIFVLSIFLQTNILFFESVCFWCIMCLVILFLETAFGICLGCKLYFLAIKLGLKKEPKVKPNCMGDSCEV